MTFYPDTTLLPSSPPHKTLDDIIGALCNNCIEISDNPNTSREDVDQIFDYTMSLIEFWYLEFSKEGLYFEHK